MRRARLRPEGVEHDRRFMLLKVVGTAADDDNSDKGGNGGEDIDATQKTTRYKPVQVYRMPEAALFSQRLVRRQAVAGVEDENGNQDREPDAIEVIYNTPSIPVAPAHPMQSQALTVPLRPAASFLAGCEAVNVSLMGSAGAGYRMGEPYDAWFSACLGYEAHLVYVGDFQRPVLAGFPLESSESKTHGEAAAGTEGGAGGVLSQVSSWLPWSSSLAASPAAGAAPLPGPSLVYNECAPFLVANRASLRDFSQRFEGDGGVHGVGMDMTKFRPNIVVDDDDEEGETNKDGCKVVDNREIDGTQQRQQPDRLEPWEEDYWGELTISPPAVAATAAAATTGRSATDAVTLPSQPATISAPPSAPSRKAEAGGKSLPLPGRRCCRLELTANCGRCISINVDYATGRAAAGDQGAALKKLTRDRRVDAGAKYTPIFGRYAFLVGREADGDDDDGDTPESNKSGPSGSSSSSSGGGAGVEICVGDRVAVTRRKGERDVWSWPKYDA